MGRSWGGAPTQLCWLPAPPTLPGIVLKKGRLHSLDHEAQLLWVAEHPCVVHLYGMVSTSEADPDDNCPLVYLAPERLGPSIDAMLEAGTRQACIVLCSDVACCTQQANTSLCKSCLSSKVEACHFWQLIDWAGLPLCLHPALVIFLTAVMV